MKHQTMTDEEIRHVAYANHCLLVADDPAEVRVVDGDRLVSNLPKTFILEA